MLVTLTGGLYWSYLWYYGIESTLPSSSIWTKNIFRLYLLTWALLPEAPDSFSISIFFFSLLIFCTFSPHQYFCFLFFLLTGTFTPSLYLRKLCFSLLHRDWVGIILAYITRLNPAPLQEPHNLHVCIMFTPSIDNQANEWGEEKRIKKWWQKKDFFH